MLETKTPVEVVSKLAIGYGADHLTTKISSAGSHVRLVSAVKQLPTSIEIYCTPWSRLEDSQPAYELNTI